LELDDKEPTCLQASGTTKTSAMNIHIARVFLIFISSPTTRGLVVYSNSDLDKFSSIGNARNCVENPHASAHFALAGSERKLLGSRKND
jgi:hypothetical protein